MTETEELLTIGEAATVLGIKVQSLYNLRSMGRGPLSYRQRGRVVYPRSELYLYRAREREATLKGSDA